MGLCLSICNKDVFGSPENAPLLSEDFLHQERVAQQKREALDKIIEDTRSKFVDINSFVNIKESAPSRDLLAIAEKEKFNFGNGMVSHYSDKDEGIDASYEVLPGKLSEDEKSELRQVMQSYSEKLEGLKAQLSGKIVGKI